MTQNIYDDEAFFSAYSQLPRSVHGLAAMPEWPTLRAMLPPLHGRRVLDLGCGYGWFCRWAHEQGAASVSGLDVSERMLHEARARTTTETISYARADLERVDLPAAQFDLIYSSLAFHYLEDLARVLHAVRRALVASGSLVFSVEHPLFTAPRRAGFIDHPAGHRTWPVDGYTCEGPRSVDWLAKGVIKQHRTLETYLRLLREAKLGLTQLHEWVPTQAQIDDHPEWADERERPAFLLIACENIA